LVHDLRIHLARIPEFIHTTASRFTR